MKVVFRIVACQSARKTRNLTIGSCFTDEKVYLIDLKILSANALNSNFSFCCCTKKNHPKPKTHKNSWSVF